MVGTPAWTLRLTWSMKSLALAEGRLLSSGSEDSGEFAAGVNCPAAVALRDGV